MSAKVLGLVIGIIGTIAGFMLSGEIGVGLGFLIMLASWMIAGLVSMRGSVSNASG